MLCYCSRENSCFIFIGFLFISNFLSAIKQFVLNIITSVLTLIPRTLDNDDYFPLYTNIFDELNYSICPRR